MKNKNIPELGFYPKISKENFAYLVTLMAFCFSFSKYGTDDYIIKSFLALLVIVFSIAVLINVENKKGGKHV